MTLDAIANQGITGIIVEVQNPDTPFGGVQVFGATDIPIQVEFAGRSGSGSGGPSVPTTANLLAGDGIGGITDSSVAPAMLVLKNPTFPTPTTLNTVIKCLQEAGLCI